MNHDGLGNQDHDDHRREVNHEIVKREPDLRADHDVGRIADQGGGAADVGGENLADQERIGRNFELLGDGEGDRNDQQDRRHVVEKRGKHRRRDLQQQQDAGRMRACRLGRPDGDVLEHARAPRDRYRISMPVSRPIVFQSMPRIASSWVITPSTTMTAAPTSVTTERLICSEMITA